MCRTVSVEEIANNDYNLNLSIYVDTTEPEEDVSVRDELELLRKSQNERDEVEERMARQMETLNYE
jgi:type I restriction enzyme M protein